MLLEMILAVQPSRTNCKICGMHRRVLSLWVEARLASGDMQICTTKSPDQFPRYITSKTSLLIRFSQSCIWIQPWHIYKFSLNLHEIYCKSWRITSAAKHHYDLSHPALVHVSENKGLRSSLILRHSFIDPETTLGHIEIMTCDGTQGIIK